MIYVEEEHVFLADVEHVEVDALQFGRCGYALRELDALRDIVVLDDN